MNKTPNSLPLTLEGITQQRKEALRRVRAQRSAVEQAARALFAPPAPVSSKGEALLRAFNTGSALVDGVMLGLKLVKRVRQLL
ncbi:MAG: hypothetical protein LBM06_02565 [Prevotellaceae bacterium]|jgi:hypothetical protein|nr:hypothetical protein [Prevotellaceae bacterium]